MVRNYKRKTEKLKYTEEEMAFALLNMSKKKGKVASGIIDLVASESM